MCFKHPCVLYKRGGTGQAIALLPCAVLLCKLSSVLLGIYLHSNFSGALVSPSLIATSALEMEDLAFPICISSSLFASLSLFCPPFSHICICFQEQREAGCVYARAGCRPLGEQPASLCAHLVLLFACSLII